MRSINCYISEFDLTDVKYAIKMYLRQMQKQWISNVQQMMIKFNLLGCKC